MSEDPRGPANDADKSFVRKVKSRVTGLLPSTLSRWFGGEVRQREEDDDSYQLQPPMKRLKPTHDSSNGSRSMLNSTISDSFVMPSASSASTSFNNQPTLLKAKRLVLPQPSRTDFKLPAGTTRKHCESDSEESTSGYSSKDVDSSEKCTSPKNGLFNLSRVLGNETTLFADKSLNTSLSSRRPAFNASFGSPNFMDRSLSTKRIVNSPFYSGRTAYGGASAYNTTVLKRSPEIKRLVPQRINETKHVNLSKTAQRILDTLEQYTSPSADVKRIPNPKRQKTDGILTKFIGANPYVLRDVRVASNTELQVPTTTNLLNMKMKLQESTSTVRDIATKTTCPLNQDEYQLRTEEPKETVKSSNKMKNKISSVRQKISVDEPQVEVKLPDIQLPISCLPTFDFTIPALKVKETSKVEKSEPAINFEYNFSKPLVLAENIKKIKAINNFKFSEPVCKRSKHDSESEETEEKSSKIGKHNGEIKETNKTSKYAVSVSASEVKQQVTTFMEKLEKTSESLANKFKPAEGSWECSVCMIRNASDKKKCAACETPNKSTEVQKAAELTKVAPPPPTITGGFGDKFKMSTSQWECAACMIRNNASAVKCVACETPKPGAKTEEKKIEPSFGSEFKKKESEWECDSCMVRNPASNAKCLCCEAAKPGSVTVLTQPASAAKPISTFNFGIDKAQLNGMGITFGIAPQAKVETGKDKLDSGLFGKIETPAPAPAASFVFGVKPPNGAKVEIKKDTETPNFAFETKSFTPALKTDVKATPFSLNGETKETKDSKDVKEVKELKESKEVKSGGFAFGKTATSSTPQATNMFTFGGGNATEKKTDSFVFKPLSKETKLPGPMLNGAKEPEKFPTFMSKETARLPVFGTSASPAPAKLPVFGSPAPPGELPRPAAFGSNAVSPQQQSQPAPPTTSNLFGGPATMSTSSAPNGMFSFGAKPTPAAAALSPPPPAYPTLPVLPSTPKPPVFSFGAAPAAAAAATPQPPTGGFNFGSNAAPAPAASTGGGFNFGPAATAFNPEAKPMFNFTAGGTAIPTSFGATSEPSASGAGAMKHRVIRKAMRRTQR